MKEVRKYAPGETLEWERVDGGPSAPGPCALCSRAQPEAGVTIIVRQELSICEHCIVECADMLDSVDPRILNPAHDRTRARLLVRALRLRARIHNLKALHAKDWRAWHESSESTYRTADAIEAKYLTP